MSHAVLECASQRRNAFLRDALNCAIQCCNLPSWRIVCSTVSYCWIGQCIWCRSLLILVYSLPDYIKMREDNMYPSEVNNENCNKLYSFLCTRQLTSMRRLEKNITNALFTYLNLTLLKLSWESILDNSSPCATSPSASFLPILLLILLSLFYDYNILIFFIPTIFLIFSLPTYPHHTIRCPLPQPVAHWIAYLACFAGTTMNRESEANK